jgi:hypothetical protein
LPEVSLRSRSPSLFLCVAVITVYTIVPGLFIEMGLC